MVLLSLASKQIWPQALAVAYFKPAKAVLLHSGDVWESKGPAQRLKKFFDKSALVPKGGACLKRIPHDDFNAIEARLDELAAEMKWNLGECRLNFTGGNKLMAAAAFRWAAKRGVASFYLERGSQITLFEPRDGDLATRVVKLDGSITDSLNPLDLLRCQLNDSEVERDGQTLTLNAKGRDAPEAEFKDSIKAERPLDRYLNIEGTADRMPNKGDALEYNAAAVLLKLGVCRVQRSLRLQVKTANGVSARKPHAEIDLLFNWFGRLWLVDCKDKRPVEDLADNLQREMHAVTNEARKWLDRIRSELSIGHTKALKEDLIAIREMGGLLGNVVCVRKSPMPEEVNHYARNNNISVVEKAYMFDDFRALLYPERPASDADLNSLVDRFQK